MEIVDVRRIGINIINNSVNKILFASYQVHITGYADTIGACVMRF